MNELEVENQTEVEEVEQENRVAIDKCKEVLLAMTQDMFVNPVTVAKGARKDGGDSVKNRLPLTWFIDTAEGYYYPPVAVAEGVDCSLHEVAVAVVELHQQRKVYIDTIGRIDLNDVRAVERVFDDFTHSCIRSDKRTAKRKYTVKMYMRDITCPKPSTKGVSRKPMIVPRFITKMLKVEHHSVEGA